jgi:hypothetical protein
MPFEKGHKRIPGSGRKPGTPNKSRMYVDICLKLEELGYDLVGEAVRLLKKRTTPTEYKIRLMLGLMSHAFPKRLAVASNTRITHGIDRETVLKLQSDPAIAKALERATFLAGETPARLALPAPALPILDAETEDPPSALPGGLGL